MIQIEPIQTMIYNNTQATHRNYVLHCFTIFYPIILSTSTMFLVVFGGFMHVEN
jgi:hypothetical protein